MVQICSMKAHGGLNSKAGEYVAHWGVDRVAVGTRDRVARVDEHSRKRSHRGSANPHDVDGLRVLWQDVDSGHRCSPRRRV